MQSYSPIQLRSGRKAARNIVIKTKATATSLVVADNQTKSDSLTTFSKAVVSLEQNDLALEATAKLTSKLDKNTIDTNIKIVPTNNNENDEDSNENEEEEDELESDVDDGLHGCNQYYNENDFTMYNQDELPKGIYSDDTEKLMIISSQKRKKNGEFGKKLCLNGYFYTIADQNTTRTLWRCEKYKTCSAKIQTKSEFVRDVTSFPVHNHEPYYEQEECLKVKHEIRQQAQKTREKPRNIIQRAKLEINKDVVPYLSNDRSLKAMVNRIRSKNADYGKAPTSTSEIDICDELAMTYNNEEFIFFDSGQKDSKRCIIFSTEFNLDVLASNDVWFVDGTFKVCPKIFYQLFNVNIRIGGRSVPMISACLFSKEESEYDKCFSEISKAIKRHPRLIVSDFEKAILNSLAKYFPNSRVAGCYFHLTQNLWRKMGEYNLQTKYDKEKENRIYKSFSCLKCLAFLPPNDVIRAFQFIKTSSPAEFAGILKYFETYYIGKRVKQNADYFL